MTLAVAGARQRLAWGLLLQRRARDESVKVDVQGGFCIDTAELLSQDLIEMCGECVSVPWASATLCLEIGMD